jgi:GNAT superfamily N-acetyltransferase
MAITIWHSTAADAVHLPALERSAGYLFRTVADLAWIADGEDMPVERHLELIAAGTSWIAETDGGHRVAFLCAEMATDALHVWELAVALAHQRQGLGLALMNRAVCFARTRRMSWVTLTTFRDVPWNEPYYRKMGFATLRAGEIDPRLRGILEREVSLGFPAERRCAMRMALVARQGE